MSHNPSQITALQAKTRDLEAQLAKARLEEDRRRRQHNIMKTSNNAMSPAVAQAIDTTSDELRGLIAQEHAAIEEKLRSLGHHHDVGEVLSALTRRITSLEARDMDTSDMHNMSSQLQNIQMQQQHESRTREATEQRIHSTLRSFQEEIQDQHLALTRKVEEALRNYRVEVSHVQTLQEQTTALITAATTVSNENENSSCFEETSNAGNNVRPLVIHTNAADALAAIKQRDEEVEILRLALVNDRCQRENDTLELQREVARLRHEVQNLQRNQHDMGKRVQRCEEASQAAAETVNPRIGELYETVMEDLERVKKEHRVILHGMDTITQYVEYETCERRKEGDALRDGLHDVQHAVQSKKKLTRSGSSRSRTRKCYVDPSFLVQASPNSTSISAKENGMLEPDFADSFETCSAALFHERRTRFGRIDTPLSADIPNINPLVESSAHDLNLSLVLRDFYTLHNPDRLTNIPKIVKEYDGATEELFEALEAQYNAYGFFQVWGRLASNPHRLQMLRNMMGNYCSSS
eukprot:PhM_4_TR9804/c0_g1_i1/m.77878